MTTTDHPTSDRKRAPRPVALATMRRRMSQAPGEWAFDTYGALEAIDTITGDPWGDHAQDYYDQDPDDDAGARETMLEDATAYLNEHATPAGWWLGWNADRFGLWKVAR